MSKAVQVSVKRNILFNIILSMSSLIFPLITFPYVSRVLAAEGIGRVAFATSTVSYFLMVAQMGIPTYGIRACAQVRDDKAKLTQTVREIFAINAVMSVLAFALLIVATALVPQFREDRTLILIIGTSIFFNLIGVEWLYKGMEEYGFITSRTVLFKAVALVAMFLLVHQPQDYVVYGGITIFAASASSVCNFFHANRFVAQGQCGKLDCCRHLKPIFVFFAMTCATTIYTNLDTVMLGMLTSSTEVGYYNTAVKVKSILIAVVTSTGAALLPRISYYIKSGADEEFRRISQKAVRFVTLLAFPLTAYFTIYAQEAVLFLAGDGYLPAVLPMQVIMPTLVFIGLSNLTGIQILVPKGREKQVLYSEIAGAVVDFCLNLMLIPHLGATGAALGTVAAEAVVLAVQIGFLGSERCEVFHRTGFGLILAATLVSGLAGLLVKPMPLGVFPRLVVSAIVFFGVYLVIMLWRREPLTREILGMVGKLLHRKAKQ